MPGWTLTTVWFDERGLPEKGVLQLRFDSGDGVSQYDLKPDPHLRRMLFQLVQADLSDYLNFDCSSLIESFTETACVRYQQLLADQDSPRGNMFPGTLGTNNSSISTNIPGQLAKGGSSFSTRRLSRRLSSTHLASMAENVVSESIEIRQIECIQKQLSLLSSKRYTVTDIAEQLASKTSITWTYFPVPGKSSNQANATAVEATPETDPTSPAAAVQPPSK